MSIHYVYERKDGKLRLTGGYSYDGTNFDVLADYNGHLFGFPRGPLDDRNRRRLEAMERNPYFYIVDQDDLKAGKHPELIPEMDLPPGEPEEPQAQEPAPAQQPQRPSVFQYHRVGVSQPVTVEMIDGRMVMNGQTLSPQEAHRLMQNVRQRLATLRYVQPMQKSESDPVQEKKLPEKDFMTPLGNLASYESTMADAPEGVHLALSCNDLRGMNATHGENVGDKIIAAVGHNIDQAKGEGQAWRHGGDEFRVLMPDLDSAARFLRQLREQLSKIPPVGGTHNLAFSAGVSTSPDDSKKALDQARKQRTLAAYPAGQSRSHVFLLMPEATGPVPAESEILPLEKPAEPEPS